jgi:trans-2,3-dihydro-3-hydroxyanthranilate isomerase
MDFAYQTVDVFTEARFGGNPLAVLLDARGLSGAQMQQIAAEFRYSETTFVLPPADPANTAQVRIFTPTSEVPFAGHPNVGTAYVLAGAGALFGRPLGDQMCFEERAGLVAVTIERDGDALRGAVITAPEALSRLDLIPAELVAACASLDPADVDTAAHQPQRVSVGLPFVVARLASRAALARARPNVAQFAAADRAFPNPFGFSLFLYVPGDAAGASVAARMFAPLDDVLEDPATGSASGALGALLAALNPAADADARLVVLQGEDMGRPSRIELAVRKRSGLVEQVRIGGACVPVMQGTLTL